jgi:hypothetical protein
LRFVRPVGTRGLSRAGRAHSVHKLQNQEDNAEMGYQNDCQFRE